MWDMGRGYGMFLLVSNLEKICIHMEFAQYLHNFVYKAHFQNFSIQIAYCLQLQNNL